jgi:hypothetical protein
MMKQQGSIIYYSQSIFNYNNQGKYSSKGYKPTEGLNFN